MTRRVLLTIATAGAAVLTYVLFKLYLSPAALVGFANAFTC